MSNLQEAATLIRRAWNGRSDRVEIDGVPLQIRLMEKKKSGAWLVASPLDKKLFAPRYCVERN
jgi:hypothetical protein